MPRVPQELLRDSSRNIDEWTPNGTTARLVYHTSQDTDTINALREITAIGNFEPTITLQDASETDINTLMRRMGVKDGSELPAEWGMADPRYYGDFTETPRDLQEAIHRTRDAEDAFSRLPANIRTKFENDPYQLWNWINKEENLPEAYELGLLARPLPTTTPAPKVENTPTPE